MSTQPSAAATSVLERLNAIEAKLNELSLSDKSSNETLQLVKRSVDSLVTKALNDRQINMENLMDTKSKKDGEKTNTMSIVIYWNANATDAMTEYKYKVDGNPIVAKGKNYSTLLPKYVKDEVVAEKANTQAWNNKSPADKEKVVYNASWAFMKKPEKLAKLQPDQAAELKDLVARVQADFEAFKTQYGISAKKSSTKTKKGSSELTESLGAGSTFQATSDPLSEFS